MAVKTGNKKGKVYLGNRKAKRAYLGTEKVYSAGNICTYHVDGVIYQEEVDEGASCLAAASFVPQKDGWEFLGWRDTQTAGDALEDKVMGDEPVDLYAMFKYPNMKVNIGRRSWNAPSWPAEYIMLSGVDTAKYKSVYFVLLDVYIKSDFKDSTLSMYLDGGGSHRYLATGTWQKEGHARYCPYVLDFSNSSGQSDVKITFSGDSTTMSARVELDVFQEGNWDKTAELIGRTIVG